MSIKADFIQELEAEMDALEKEIMRLKVVREQAPDPLVQQGLTDEINVLRDEYAAFRQKVLQLETTPDNAWEEARAGAEKTWFDIKQKFNQLAEKISEIQ